MRTTTASFHGAGAAMPAPYRFGSIDFAAHPLITYPA
jgi:hypothetical protein